MMHSNPASTAKMFGHPIHPMLIPFPIAFFVAAFAADLVYLANGETGWASAVVVLLLLFTGWKGWELVYRHRVAVSDADEAHLGQTRSL